VSHELALIVTGQFSVSNVDVLGSTVCASISKYMNDSYVRY